VWHGNTDDAKIDVYITTYNHPAWIDDCVQSVVEQDVRCAFNIYIYDDHSNRAQYVNHRKTDAPRTVLWELRRRNYGTYQRPIHLDIEIGRKNLGASAARNHIAMTRGKAPWILFVDGDDKLDAGFLEAVWRRAHIDKADAVYPKIAIFSDEGAVQHGTVAQGPFILPKIMRSNYIPVTTLLRRSAFADAGGFDEKMRDGFEDWELWLRLGFAGVVFCYEETARLLYRHHSGARSHGANARMREIYQYIQGKHRDEFATRLRPVIEEID